MPGVADGIKAAFLTSGSYHVHGPVALYVGESLPNVTPGTLKGLGVTTEGVSVAFKVMETSIETDASGKGVPAEYALQGMVADLAFKLGNYDRVQLEELVRRSAGAKGAAADSPFASGGLGQLVASGGLAFRLVIDSPTLPIRFYTCKLRGDLSKLLSTDFTKPDVRVHSWMFVPGGYLTGGPDSGRPGSPGGVVLYDHVAE